MNARRVYRSDWIAMVVLMIVGASFIAGCSTQAPPESPSPGQQITTVTAIQTVSANRPAPGSVTAVDFNLLTPFLPEAPLGWTADDRFGETMNETDEVWTVAFRMYIIGESKEADVSITDSAYYNVDTWESWGSQEEMTTTEGYNKAGTVAGFPSRESYDKSSNLYETRVGLNDRFMVTVTIYNGEKSDLDLFVNSINYQGIAALR